MACNTTLKTANDVPAIPKVKMLSADKIYKLNDVKPVTVEPAEQKLEILLFLFRAAYMSAFIKRTID